jgi:hypothetical protein
METSKAVVHFREQVFSDITANETCTAGDQDFLVASVGLDFLVASVGLDKFGIHARVAAY